VIVLSWNLFHGRSSPGSGRPLAAEFSRALAGWEWDLALLQEVPPWWPEPLARACGAQWAAQRTSRNSLLGVRRAIASRNPDLLGANGGGANAILVRGPILERRSARLTWCPERRWAHGVRVPDRGWVVNLHATTEPKWRTRSDIARAVVAWPEHPLVLGGDFNLREPPTYGLERAGGHHVDHVLVRGWRPVRHEVPDAGTLSDHRPLRVELG
jgi:endonuclease/exonuclease/phosphatase family metal-dependent hydrolase